MPIALAQTILMRRKGDYAALEAANRTNEITPLAAVVRGRGDRGATANDGER
jgi:hypothetical protein